MAEKDKVTDLEFKWGKRRVVSGKKKEVQFYESFTYDGVEYTLYDCVYMYKEGEPEPYIGKLINIWESADKTKKVKVQWFFHPSEILSWLGDEMVLENEIFLATGEGIGLANINPLEAIAGKSNVVCISNDNRNCHPSEEELKMADYIFYRTFDVGRCTILDKMDDNVGGLEIKFIFNRKESEHASGIPKLVSGSKEEIKNAIVYNGKEQLSIQNTPVEFKFLRNDGDHNQSATAKDVKDSLAKCESLRGVKPESGSGVKSNALATTSLQQASALGQKGSRCGVDALKADISRVTDNKVKAEERLKSVQDSDALDDRPTKKPRIDNSIKSPVDKSINCAQKLIVQGNDVKPMVKTATAFEEKRKSGRDKDPLRQDKRVKSAKESGDFEDRPVKKAKTDCSAKEKNRNNIQKVTVNSDGNHATDLVRSGTSNGERTKSRLNMDSLGLKSPSMKKLDEKTRNISSVKLPKVSASGSANEHIETEGKVFEVTRRPDAADKSKWFRTPPWEERMRIAHERGTLVLLRNLDPEYTSGEVEVENKELEFQNGRVPCFRVRDGWDVKRGIQVDVFENLFLEDFIRHAFDEFCSAKMVLRTAISSPHSGQAIVIFKTREATGRVIRKLHEGCLMLPNGRPLVGSAAPPPNFPGKLATYFGHLVIDNMKIKLQREMKDAVSTSHCSQPNTIEYDMAMEWCLLQSRSDSWWERLHKQQGQELRKLKANLKSK